MKKRFPAKYLVIAALVASGPVLANTVNEEVTTIPGHQLSPQDEMAISSAAVKVLRHIADARGELQGDKIDTKKASEELDKSKKLLDIIQASLPTTKIKDHIWVAKKHLEYEDTREVLPDLIPIYSSLEELVDYMPTSQAKDHLDQAKQALENGDKSQAKEQLLATDDALLYVEADLPLSSTRRLVDQAKADLVKDDIKSANQALRAAEDNTVFISIAVNSPIVQAKAALWKASQDYNLGNKEFAKTDLNNAVTYLERAAQEGDKIAREAAKNLVSDIRDMHQLITSNDKDIGSRIESAWQRTKALTERSAEYISTGWQRLHAEGAGKQDLIEAKLQLAYARIDYTVAKDNDASIVDLAEAESYLKAATNEVNNSVKSQLDNISSEVAQLDDVLHGDRQIDSTVANFNKTESQLAKLIYQL
jgi:hypothetical protein